MNDLISRKETFRVLSDYYHHRTEEQHKALKEALERVPGTEQNVVNLGHVAKVNSITMIQNLDWIQVTERLPEKFLDRRILVSTVSPTGRRSVDIGLWEGGKWTTYFPIGDDRVTAWMPLPEPWKGEE